MENKIQHILENLNTAILYLNGSLEIQYMNPAAEMLFETGRRSCLGRHVEHLIKGRTKLIGRMQQALETERPFSERALVLRINHSRTTTVDCTVSTPSDQGEEKNLLLEFIQIDRQLRITREEGLIEQQLTLRKLLRGLAHEIKNPLGGIRGAAQLLEKELDDPQLTEFTRVIIDESDRLKTLVDQLLGPNELPKKRLFNIHEVLERVYALVRVTAPEVELIRDYDPSIPNLTGDPEKLIQAVLNLAKNAVEALHGKGVIRIRSRAQRQFTIGNTRHKLVAVIEVCDNGAGIPADMADKIFLPMVTGRPEGTGLGLSIAQSIVNHHGGVIEFQSEPGNTVFQVLLPLEL